MLQGMRVYMEVPDEDAAKVHTAAVREGREFRGQLKWIIHLWALLEAPLEERSEPEQVGEVA